jgi:formylmethanofuran dehydrogenase subunit A
MPEVTRQISNLAEISRELTLSEMAIITRGAPARRSALTDEEHHRNVRNRPSGLRVRRPGRARRPSDPRDLRPRRFDINIERRVDAFYDRHHGADSSWFAVTANIGSCSDRFATVPCLN